MQLLVSWFCMFMTYVAIGHHPEDYQHLERTETDSLKNLPKI